MSKIYLNVPYSQKEFAKKYGARWNPERKRWYVTDSIPSELEVYAPLFKDGYCKCLSCGNTGLKNEYPFSTSTTKCTECFNN